MAVLQEAERAWLQILHLLQKTEGSGPLGAAVLMALSADLDQLG